MPSRRAFLVASSLLLAQGAAPATEAKRRLGILWYGRDQFDADAKGFFEAMATLGWEQGRNLEVIAPYFDPRNENMPLEKGVAQIVADGAEVVLADGTTITRAVRRAAPRMPLVVTVADPVGLGFATTLVNPRGNVTGISQGQRETAGKVVQLLRSVVPRLARVTILFGADEVTAPEFAAIVEGAARREGIEPRTYLLKTEAEMVSAIRETAAKGDGGAYVGNVGLGPAKRMAAAAIAHRLPTITTYPAWVVDAGLLMSFRLYDPDQGSRFAAMVDKILRGANPGGIPFELPRLSELVVNRRTANAMRLALPEDLLLRADRVVG